MKTKFFTTLVLGLLLSTPSSFIYAQNWLNNNQSEETTSCLMQNDYSQGAKMQNHKKGKHHNNESKGNGRKGQEKGIFALFKNNAEINAKINQIKEKDTRLLQMFNHDIKMQLKQFRMLLHDKENSKEVEQDLIYLVNNELDSLILSIGYRENPDNTTKTQLKNLLEKSFSLKEKLHKQHIKSVRSRTEKLEEMLEKRKEHKEEIIEMRLTKLTETKNDTFSW